MAGRGHGGIFSLDEPVIIYPRLPFFRNLCYYVHGNSQYVQQFLRCILILRYCIRSWIFHGKLLYFLFYF